MSIPTLEEKRAQADRTMRAIRLGLLTPVGYALAVQAVRGVFDLGVVAGCVFFAAFAGVGGAMAVGVTGDINDPTPYTTAGDLVMLRCVRALSVALAVGCVLGMLALPWTAP